MPNYQGEQDFQHGAPTRAGVLLVNLGTPAAPTWFALRRYLKEFLSDPRVMELPRWLRWLILNGIILNIRPGISAKAYRRVWTDAGSPLLSFSRKQRAALQSVISATLPSTIVELGMRYGEPSVPSALERLRRQGARRILILPLYPQYSGTSTGSVFDAVADTLKRWRWVPELRFINAYHDNEQYINAIAEQIREQWSQHERSKRLLFSFHGIPKRYQLAGDPYHCQCHKSARLVARALDLSDDEWIVVFQSRFGRAEWLQPYCEETIKSLPGRNIKSVDIVCPGFAVDCLETLEEIGQHCRQVFLDAGGERYHYIPCLNDRPAHIAMMGDLIAQQLQGWPEPKEAPGADAVATLSRAQALGAGREI
jgi:ferrochelatase